MKQINRKVLTYIRKHEGCTLYDIEKIFDLNTARVMGILSSIEKDQEKGVLFYSDKYSRLYIFEPIKNEEVMMPKVILVKDIKKLPKKTWRFASSKDNKMEDAVNLFECRYGHKPEVVYQHGKIICVEVA